MPRRKKDKLISFAVPNPNPDNDLTTYETWVGEQDCGHRPGSPAHPVCGPGKPQALRRVCRSGPRWGLPFSGCLETISHPAARHCSPSQGHDKGAREWLDTGVGSTGTHRGGGRWAKFPEVPGCTDRVPWADRASLVTGSVSSRQHTAGSGYPGCREGGRKGCASTCSQPGPARCLTARHLFCGDSRALGIPGGWVAGPFALWVAGTEVAHPPSTPPH